MSRHFALFLPLLAASLAACSSGAEDSEPPPAPAPSLTTQPVPTEAADGTALTPGRWSVEENAQGASATFGQADSEPDAVLACHSEAKALTLTRAAQAAGPQAFLLQVGELRARVDMTAADGPLPGYSAQVDGSLPLFAAMADPAEAILLSGAGLPDLLMPANRGIARVLEACR